MKKSLQAIPQQTKGAIITGRMRGAYELLSHKTAHCVVRYFAKARKIIETLIDKEQAFHLPSGEIPLIVDRLFLELLGTVMGDLALLSTKLVARSLGFWLDPKAKHGG